MFNFRLLLNVEPTSKSVKSVFTSGRLGLVSQDEGDSAVRATVVEGGVENKPVCFALLIRFFAC